MYIKRKTNNLNIKALRNQIFSIYREVGFIKLLIYFLNVVHNTYIKKYVLGSFSQKGEDLILEHIFGKKRNGFYIDIGAHNPDIFNNTKRFYQKGWHGINIEPNPRLIKAFYKQRTRDINLHIGVGKTSGSARFFEFIADGLSTFSKTEAEKNIQLGYKIKKVFPIPIYSLKEIMKKYVRSNVDFISVDTEGLDLQVLQGNDWQQCRPKAVCVETGDFFAMIKGQAKSEKKQKIDAFMGKNGYKSYYTNGLNTIYINERFIPE